MDLEEEFRMLLEEMRDSIRAKVSSRNLTYAEAQALENMIEERLENGTDNGSSAWTSSEVCW